MAGADAKDVNVAEVHDCFSVMGAIGTEVIGKAEPGKGAQLLGGRQGVAGGECGINTSGGLIAKGHPIGATGVAMIGWSRSSCWARRPPRLRCRIRDAGGDVQYRRPDLRQRLHRVGRVAGGGLLYTPPHEHFEAEIPASGWGVGSGDSGRGGQRRQ